MSEDHAPSVRIEAIAALNHFKSEAAVKALLAITELPVDYYIIKLCAVLLYSIQAGFCDSMIIFYCTS